MFTQVILMFCCVFASYQQRCNEAKNIFFLVDSTNTTSSRDFQVQKDVIRYILNEFKPRKLTISVRVYQGDANCRQQNVDDQNGFYDETDPSQVRSKLNFLEHRTSKDAFELPCAEKLLPKQNLSSKHLSIILAKYKSAKKFIHESEQKKFKENGTYFLAFVYSENNTQIKPFARRDTNINDMSIAIMEHICPSYVANRTANLRASPNEVKDVSSDLVTTPVSVAITGSIEYPTSTKQMSPFLRLTSVMLSSAVTSPSLFGSHMSTPSVGNALVTTQVSLTQTKPVSLLSRDETSSVSLLLLSHGLSSSFQSISFSRSKDAISTVLATSHKDVMRESSTAAPMDTTLSKIRVSQPPALTPSTSIRRTKSFGAIVTPTLSNRTTSKRLPTPVLSSSPSPSNFSFGVDPLFPSNVTKKSANVLTETTNFPAKRLAVSTHVLENTTTLIKKETQHKFTKSTDFLAVPIPVSISESSLRSGNSTFMAASARNATNKTKLPQKGNVTVALYNGTSKGFRTVMSDSQITSNSISETHSLDNTFVGILTNVSETNGQSEMLSTSTPSSRTSSLTIDSFLKTSASSIHISYSKFDFNRTNRPTNASLVSVESTAATPQLYTIQFHVNSSAKSSKKINSLIVANISITTKHSTTSNVSTNMSEVSFGISKSNNRTASPILSDISTSSATLKQTNTSHEASLTYANTVHSSFVSSSHTFVWGPITLSEYTVTTDTLVNASDVSRTSFTLNRSSTASLSSDDVVLLKTQLQDSTAAVRISPSLSSPSVLDIEISTSSTEYENNQSPSNTIRASLISPPHRTTNTSVVSVLKFESSLRKRTVTPKISTNVRSSSWTPPTSHHSSRLEYRSSIIIYASSTRQHFNSTIIAHKSTRHLASTQTHSVSTTSTVLVNPWSSLDSKMSAFIHQNISEAKLTDKKWISAFIDNSSSILEELGNATDEPVKVDILSLDFVAYLERVLMDVGDHLHMGDNINHKTRNMVIEISAFNATSKDDFHFGEANSIESFVIPNSNFRGYSEEKAVIVAMSYSTLPAMKKSKKHFSPAEKVLMINVAPPLQRPFKKSISYSLLAKKSNFSNHECVFWNNSGWDNTGCKVSNTSGQLITCDCDHMTSFSILMQVSDFEIPNRHRFILSLITYVGCGASIFACILLIIVYMMCGGLVNMDRNIIHINLAIAIAVSNGLFICADSVFQYKHVCLGVSIGMYYSYLASFFWMLVEGIHVYLMVVKVFKSPRKMHAYMVIGWVVPAVIAVLAAFKLHDKFTRDDFCWLSLESYTIWIFVGPVLFVVLVNTLILIATLNASHKMSVDETEFSKLQRIARLTLLLMPIFGLTWVFGVLAVNKQLLFFQYVFTGINSFQGLFIFLCYCVLNNEVKREYQRVRRKSQYSSTKSNGTSENGFSAHIHPSSLPRKRIKSALSTEEDLPAVTLTHYDAYDPAYIGYYTRSPNNREPSENLADTLTKRHKKQYSIELLKLQQTADDTESVNSLFANEDQSLLVRASTFSSRKSDGSSPTPSTVESAPYKTFQNEENGQLLSAYCV